jgi:hypothetical protein
MGRHSVPDDDSEQSTALVVRPPADRRPRPGRHARPDDDEAPPIQLEAVSAAPDTLPTERIAAIERPEPEPAEPVAELGTELDTEPIALEPAVPTSARVGKGNQSTAADLELLREHSDVRARVIAAIIVPFVLYTVVLYAIGAMHVYFIWIWIPLVTAGVVAGSILDAAHRKRGSGQSR